MLVLSFHLFNHQWADITFFFYLLLEWIVWGYLLITVILHFISSIFELETLYLLFRLYPKGVWYFAHQWFIFLVEFSFWACSIYYIPNGFLCLFCICSFASIIISIAWHLRAKNRASFIFKYLQSRRHEDFLTFASPDRRNLNKGSCCTPIVSLKIHLSSHTITMQQDHTLGFAFPPYL